MTKKQKKLLTRILISAVFYLPLYLISENIINVKLPKAALFLLFLIPYLLVGHDVLRKALNGIRSRQVFDENFLMAIATIGAIALGEYSEGVAVMLLYQVGELFQSYAVGKSRKNISALLDIRPDYANIEQEGQIVRADPYEISPGDEIVVLPGEKIAIDGVILEGLSTLNTSALTGESKPVDVGPGSVVLSGSVNMNGMIRIRTTAPFEESTASKILDLVENASSQKSRSEAFISRFARYYTPIVCFGALALGLLVPLIQLLSGMGMQSYDSVGQLWGDWILRACTFLVISCPCALVISIPLSFFAGIGGAGSQGILIKGANYLETLSQVRTVAFDKTGTITKGNFAVTGIHHASMDEDELLEMAALVECHSSHPISKSIQAACKKKLDQSRVVNVQEIAGEGVMALVDGKQVAAGNEKLMQRLHLTAKPCHENGTIIHVAVDGAYAGHILIADELKPNAAEAIRLLKEAGIRRCVMLTGDDSASAETVAKQTGISEVRSGLLPAQKVACVEQLLKENGAGQKLAFVGDGMNDAPVLARADVGIAMGALGSDAAIEAADIVLMDDDPAKIAKAVKIARKCLRIVKENIIFALGIKVVCLILAALGMANMWLAVAADVGVMILAVLNAIRNLAVK